MPVLLIKRPHIDAFFRILCCCMNYEAQHVCEDADKDLTRQRSKVANMCGEYRKCLMRPFDFVRKFV